MEAFNEELQTLFDGEELELAETNTKISVRGCTIASSCDLSAQSSLLNTTQYLRK